MEFLKLGWHKYIFAAGSSSAHAPSKHHNQHKLGTGVRRPHALTDIHTESHPQAHTVPILFVIAGRSDRIRHERCSRSSFGKHRVFSVASSSLLPSWYGVRARESYRSTVRPRRELVQIGAKTDPQLADVAEALIAPNVWCANVVEVIIQKLASCSRAWLSWHMFAWWNLDFQPSKFLHPRTLLELNMANGWWCGHCPPRNVFTSHKLKILNPKGNKAYIQMSNHPNFLASGWFESIRGDVGTWPPDFANWQIESYISQSAHI